MSRWLEGTSFIGCSLRNCIFDGCDLAETEFTESDLEGATRDFDPVV